MGWMKRVLLAEDNPVNQRVLLAFVRKLGFQVTLADDGHEAVRGHAVTCQTLDAQDFGRVGLQMHPVARRRDNTLPRAVGVLLDVTRRAHLARNRSVWTDFPGTEQHPLRDLSHLGDKRLVVTIVAAQIRDAMVLALLESLIDLVVQRMARETELIVVL